MSESPFCPFCGRWWYPGGYCPDCELDPPDRLFEGVLTGLGLVLAAVTLGWFAWQALRWLT